MSSIIRDYYMPNYYKPENHINSLSEQINAYRKLMKSLIHEKEGKPKDEIEIKSKKISSLAIKQFNIEGDSLFVQKIEKSLTDISMTKPGRKLLKAFFKNDINLKIKIGKSEYHKNKEITVDGLDGYYACLNIKKEKQIVQQPFQAVLFHELVHALHHNTQKTYEKDRLNILPNMTTLEEQHTIIGFSPIFSIKNSLDFLDIMCENAFLLALNLPPRIDHLHYVSEEKNGEADLSFIENERELINVYFEWLEEQLTSIRTVPEDKKEDEQFILSFLHNQPQAIQTISSRLKGDEGFLLRIIPFRREVFAYFPALSSNKTFMMKALHVHGEVAFFASPELYKDKEFVLEAIKMNCFSTEPLSKLIEDPLLKTDPEILAALNKALD